MNASKHISHFGVVVAWWCISVGYLEATMLSVLVSEEKSVGLSRKLSSRRLKVSNWVRLGRDGREKDLKHQHKNLTICFLDRRLLGQERKKRDNRDHRF